MTTATGNAGVVKVGTNTVAEVRSYTINDSADRIEDTALGDSNRTYKAGLAEVSGTIECWADESDSNGQEAMTPGAQVALTFWPDGAGTGNAELTVTATILSRVDNVAFNEIRTATFEWGAASALTRGTQS